MLESTLEQLKDDVHEIVRLRPLVARQTTDSLLKNFNAIKEVSIIIIQEKFGLLFPFHGNVVFSMY